MSSPASALKFENVLYEKKGLIAYVTLNRPKVLNALNQATWRDLQTAFEAARRDDDVRGVILTGAGDKAFIAGADIGELSTISAVEAERSSSYGQTVLNLIENLGKPVIAAINGFALGGGCELAMACTIRIAVETAKFGQPEVKIRNHARVAEERNVCHDWSEKGAHCNSFSPARSSMPRKPIASGSSTRWFPLPI